ncbi:MAG: sigma-70 family RNA polymerase sigma factor, partial [Phycisphaerae bacterium]|nr:sigma-70 family RNA polymerase sigma factor [Phycisphaerae bacterium]
FRLRGSLKAYLATSVMNRSRDYLRRRRTAPMALNDAEPPTVNSAPDSGMVLEEELARLSAALAQLPAEQREVVVLKIKAGLKFRQIAKMQDVSIDTAQARYRYGIDKLRSLLNSEMEK